MNTGTHASLPGGKAIVALHRVVAAVLLGGLVACGGSGVPGESHPGSVFLSPSTVSVAPGQSIQLQVDIVNLEPDQMASGYAISLSEEATRIRISSDACPAGVGTASCRLWTIRPDDDATPGTYAFTVRASGVSELVSPGGVTLRVLPLAVAGPAVVAASQSHVVTAEGRLWATGSNHHGETGVGFDSVGFSIDDRFVLPDSIESFVPVGSDRDWRSVVSAGASTIALKRDGTVWGWGANPRTDTDDSFHVFGFASERDIQLRPRRIDGLPAIRAISAGGSRFLALAHDSTVYAFGGVNHSNALEDPGDLQTDVPRVVPQSAAGAALGGIVAIAGGVQNSGRGWAVALHQDGSVWQMGRHDASFFARSAAGDPVPTAALPQRIDLPAPAVAVAAGAAFSLAATGTGEVWSWTEGDLLPRRVPGLAGVVELDADGSAVSALDGNGVVWLWSYGQGTPTRVAGIPRMARLAHRGPRWALSGDCGPGRGALWRLPVGQRVQTFGSGIAPDTCERGELVTLTLGKTGQGIVATDPAGGLTSIDPLVRIGLCDLDCPGPLSVNLRRRESILVRATPAPGWQFDGFNPECRDGAPLLDADTSCIATFRPEEKIGRLSVSVSGHGRIRSTPGDIDCGAACADYFRLGTTIRLSAIPDPGYAFVGWTGPSNTNEFDCRDGTVTMNVVGTLEQINTIGPNGESMPDWRVDYPLKHCTAVFGPLPQLTLEARTGGTVTSLPPGIDCGASCAQRFEVGTTITLSATADAQHRFDGFWEAACASPITLTRDLRCTPRFTWTAAPPPPAELSAVAGRFSVELAWRRDSRASEYELVRTPGVGGAAARTVVFAGPADRYVDTAVAGDTAYRYELVARNGGGSSAATTVSARTLVAADWIRVGSGDIGGNAGFAQPALALTADGNTVAVAQVFASGGLDQTQVYTNDTFAPSPWARLAGTPGGALTPAAAGTQPVVALDSQGAAVVAWTQAGPTGNDIRVARYDSASAQWVLLGGALDADPGNPTPLDATQPELVLDANDRPVVAWLHGGGAFVKRWNGSNWVWVAGGGGFGPNVNAVKLVLDADGTAHLLLRRGGGSAAQLFAYREGPAGWSALGGALNAALATPRDSLSFFDLVIDVDGSPLAVWSEGAAPHDVLARRWRNGSWQALPKLVDFETNHAITGLAVARSVQASSLAPTPPVVMVTRRPVFAGSNPRNAYGDVYLLQNDAWTQRPSLITFGPMVGLTLRVTRQATPVAAWLAETGATGSGELRLFVWRAL